MWPARPHLSAHIYGTYSWDNNYTKLQPKWKLPLKGSMQPHGTVPCPHWEKKVASLRPAVRGTHRCRSQRGPRTTTESTFRLSRYVFIHVSVHPSIHSPIQQTSTAHLTGARLCNRLGTQREQSQVDISALISLAFRAGRQTVNQRGEAM